MSRKPEFESVSEFPAMTANVSAQDFLMQQASGMSAQDEFDAIHKALVADAKQHDLYANDTESALYGYSEGAEHALDTVRLRLNAIKAQALREAAAEIERLKLIGRTPHNQCKQEQLDAYYAYAQAEQNTWLRTRADALEAQA